MNRVGTSTSYRLVRSTSMPMRCNLLKGSFIPSTSTYLTPKPTSTSTLVRPFTMSSSTAKPNGHKRQPALTIDNINPAVLHVEYAVRGELALKADQYAQRLASGDGGELPFDKVVTANIGNPQQKGLDQVPITYWRQVISLLEYPDLMNGHLELAKKIYPEDVIKRARGLWEEIGSVGAYSQSKGVLPIRKRVAKFLEERDGHPADPESIYLTAGASGGVSSILSVALRPGDGCLIPIPQYPLYTATLAYLSAKPIPYYLQEPDQWSMSHSDLVAAIKRAREDETPIKAMAIINPGNPTGACLPLEAMKSVVQLCYDEGIMLLADEVYQHNIFDEQAKPFISFKKVLRDMPKEVAESVELVSFHSISKGVSGECGRRGGYFEAVNISQDVMEQIYKMASVSLCPPLTGQVGVDLLVSPPKKGEPSYDLWKSQTSETLNNLKSRSKYMSDRFNALPGMSCVPADGAMYLLPKIEMPKRAVEEAEKRGKKADVMYTLDLLDATGICAVAGSGFGQEEGTYHVRVTALCPGVENYVGKIEQFHKDFMAKWA